MNKKSQVIIARIMIGIIIFIMAVIFIAPLNDEIKTATSSIEDEIREIDFSKKDRESIKTSHLQGSVQGKRPSGTQGVPGEVRTSRLL